MYKTLDVQLSDALDRVEQVKIHCRERDMKDPCDNCATGNKCHGYACLHKAYNECERIMKKMKQSPFYIQMFD